MATIKDIARMTGLSETTISRFMNNHPYVSNEARAAIERALEEIEYRPNASARSLRSGRTRRIAVLIDSVMLSFYSRLLDGFCEAAHERSYSILVEQAGAPGWSPDALIEQARSHNIDGVVIAVELLQANVVAALLKLVPVIACDQSIHNMNCPRVFVDHHDSTILGLSYLHERGADVIACVVGDEETICASSRYRRVAYEAFAAAHQDVTIHIVSCPDSTATGGAILLEKLTELDPAPRAVFTASDDLATGLLVAARNVGITVPQELSILGFDDMPIAEVHGITTIRQPIRYMGQRAIRNLIALIENGGKSRIKHSVRLAYELVPRRTA